MVVVMDMGATHTTDMVVRFFTDIMKPEIKKILNLGYPYGGGYGGYR